MREEKNFTIGDRIKKLRQFFKLKQSEFAEKINLNQSRISDYESNTSIPHENTVIIICTYFQVNFQWLMYGEGDMYSEQKKPIPEDIKEKPILIKIAYREDVRPAAGHGAFVNSELITCYFEFDKRYLDDYNINSKYADIITVKGSSMEPVLNDSDRIIVDRSKKKIIDGEIYCVRVEDVCKIKKIQRVGKGIKLISVNPDFDPEYPLDWEIIGKVMTIVGRRLG